MSIVVGEPEYNISGDVNYTFSRVELTMDLVTNKDVWGGPLSSAPHIIQTLIDQGIYVNFQGANVIDVGAGNGIMSIAASKLGASKVIAVDNNPSAVKNTQFNARYNQIDKSELMALESDVLSEIPEDFEADIIIGNLPMNPQINGLRIANAAFRSNQNGDDGRYVQSTLIRQARKFLKPGGMLIFSASSRQNFTATKTDLDNYFGTDNWTILNSGENLDPVDIFEGAHEEINIEYHGPFIPTWMLETSIDRKLRVYNLDNLGHPYLELESGRGKDRVKKIYCYLDINDDGAFSPVEVYINGNGIPIYNIINSDGSTSQIAFSGELPYKVDDTLYHNYSIIVARYQPNHKPEF